MEFVDQSHEKVSGTSYSGLFETPSFVGGIGRSTEGS